MNTKSVEVIVAAAAVLLILVLQPFTTVEPPENKALFAGPVAAKVGGREIRLDQLEARTAGLTSVHGSDISSSEFRERILDSFVGEAIIVDGADERGVTMSAGELALYVSGVTGVFQGESELQAFLEESHATLPQLYYRQYLNLLASRLYLDVSSQISLTEEEIREYFNEHKAEYDIAGEDPVVAFEAAKPDIANALIKQKQDAAFSEWLTEKKKHGYELTVVMEDWWKTIEATPTSEANGTTSTPSPAGG